MIIKASQRGFAANLAKHLLNGHENEKVEVHKVQGFVAQDLMDALQESHAKSLGTKCSQHLFSVSFNPPQEQEVTTEQFEKAITKAGQIMGLNNQPHAIVFHEKNGRRHAHCVWCRIDTHDIKAIPLPYYKNKMAELSKNLYLEHNWNLPKGHIDRALSNPLNFSLKEWQQAKRLGDDPKIIKQCLQECWNASGNRDAFENAIQQHGFYLAKGNRRAFVAVDWRGEIYSLSRATGVKAKELSQRLGDPSLLPDIEQCKSLLDQRLIKRYQSFRTEVEDKYRMRVLPIQRAKDNLLERHRIDMDKMKAAQCERQDAERNLRLQRFSQGIKGLWERMTGRYKKIQEHNALESYQSYQRDQKERDKLIFRQLQERQVIQNKLNSLHFSEQQDLAKIRHAVFSKLPDHQLQILELSQMKNENPKPEYISLSL